LNLKRLLEQQPLFLFSLIPPAVLVLLGSLLTSEEEEEESLSRADAVNEEDPSATALPRCRRLVPPCYVPEGGGGGGGMFIPSKHSIPVNEEFAGRDHATQP
jgi:hypothetical protein